MKHFYFAGGGTGGHIYPAIAVAEELLRTEPACEITFFCSQRPIDARILSGTGFRFIPLPVRSFSKNPYEIFLFLKSLFSAKKLVTQTILSELLCEAAIRYVARAGRKKRFCSVSAVLFLRRPFLPPRV